MQPEMQAFFTKLYRLGANCAELGTTDCSTVIQNVEQSNILKGNKLKLEILMIAKTKHFRLFFIGSCFAKGKKRAVQTLIKVFFKFKNEHVGV